MVSLVWWLVGHVCLCAVGAGKGEKSKFRLLRPSSVEALKWGSKFCFEVPFRDLRLSKTKRSSVTQ